MKSLLKYHLALIILLLIGYSQVFAPLYSAMNSCSPSNEVSGVDYVHVPFLKTSDLEGFEIEEETKRTSFAEPVRDHDSVAGLLLQQFVQHLKNQSAFEGYSSQISLLSSSPHPAFDVLRL